LAPSKEDMKAQIENLPSSSINLVASHNWFKEKRRQKTREPTAAKPNDALIAD